MSPSDLLLDQEYIKRCRELLKLTKGLSRYLMVKCSPEDKKKTEAIVGTMAEFIANPASKPGPTTLAFLIVVSGALESSIHMNEKMTGQGSPN